MAGRAVSRRIRTAFERRYLTALRAHVKSATEPRRGPAYRLGLRACALGIETLALARIHDTALAALAPASGKDTRPRRGRASRAASFFAETMGPIEASHRPAPEALATNGPEHRVLLERGAVRLASAQGRLTRETGRRRVLETMIPTAMMRAPRPGRTTSSVDVATRSSGACWI